MISVRVNEILKYLSTDKKERLKKCVQVMESVQKLDNMRTQRNNIANASSTSLSSSSCASVTEESSASESHLAVIVGGPRQLSAAAVAGMSIEVEEKDGERFQSDACNKKFTKDCKKRRPLTVLKSQNVHCTCARSTSVSEDATSIPKMKSQSIPRESVVLPKPGAQMDSQTSDPVDNLPVKKKSSRRSQKEMSDFAIDDLRQPESWRDSKKTTLQQQRNDLEQLENDLEQKLHMKGKGPLEYLEDSGPLLRSDTPSPSFTSSRKSRKQNKNKGLAAGGVAQRPVKSPSQGSTGGCYRASAESAPNGGERQFTKTPSSKDFEFSNQERKSLDLLTKEKRLKQIKVDCGRLNGCKQTSGVAELDTFEITLLRKKLQKKRCNDIPPSEALNELDGFDDPIITTVRRHSNESLGTIPASPELAEKWIEVNRKVKRVVVPSSALGRILGPDGSKLEAICNFTKAHIEQERTGNTKEITFIIRGTLEQMQAACSMISALTKDCDSQDVVRNGCTIQAKPEMTIPLEKIPSKPEARNSKESKMRAKLQRLPVVVVGNASGDRINSVAMSDQRPDEEYQESVKSGVSEQSNEPSCSERSSPDQDLLVGGEYSLFEHGLGQPLEKLLACKDSAKQTFAHAAGSRSSSQTLTVAMPDTCAVDQTLLAKAPGYRNVKSFTSRDVYYPKTQNGRMAAFPWRCGVEQMPANDASLALASSHLLPVTSRNFSIPLLERPISAPTQPLPHSTIALTFGAGPSTPPANSLAIQAFSKLNPNAPDFIFASSSEVVALNPLGDSRPNGMVDPSLCGRSVTEAEYSYVPPFARNGFKPSAEILDSVIDGTFCQGPPHLTSEETLYSLPVGDGLGSSWIRSQESWNIPKVSFGVVGREHTSANNYPSRGDAYRGYFTHPVLATSGASPYNCVFYQQQQNMMLAPVQSWLQGSQTLAQAGP